MYKLLFTNITYLRILRSALRAHGIIDDLSDIVHAFLQGARKYAENNKNLSGLDFFRVGLNHVILKNANLSYANLLRANLKLTT